MSAPGILTGGTLREIFMKGAPEGGRSYGAFGNNPGSTSKTARNAGRRDAENRDTMARLFIEIPSKRQEDFLASVPPESKELARVLMSGTGTGGSAGTGFFDFLLTNTQENFSEKAQIIDTLTDNYVLYFGGREPTMAAFNGILLNTYQDDQRVWFLRAYSSILRGTQLATRNLIARLRYDSFLASGYLLNLSMGLDSDTEITASRFSFQMVVKRLQVVSPAVFSPTGLHPSEEQPPEALTPTGDPVDTGENLAYNLREGVVTPEVPPTATDMPGGGDSYASYQNATAAMKLAGIAPQTRALIYELTGGSSVDGVDPRWVEAVQKQEGRDRVSAAVRNPDNRQNDGNAGATNQTMADIEAEHVLKKTPGLRKREASLRL